MKKSSNPNSSILLISLDWYRTKDPKTPLAMASIQSWFRNNYKGKSKSFFESYDINDPDFSISRITSRITELQPSFLAFGVYIWNDSTIKEICRIAKSKMPGIKIILGGPQISHGDSRLTAEYPNANFFIKGNGEFPFTFLMNELSMNATLNPERIKKIGIYTPKMIEKENCEFQYLAKLPDLSSPFLDGTVKIDSSQPFVRWETLRGCPYQCTFCQFRQYKNTVQTLNSNRILKELELFAEKGVRQIAVLDPVFNLKGSHFLPILKKIENLDMDAHFSFQCRLELLTKPDGKKLLEFCKRYKNVTLEFGVQTFVEKEWNAIKRNNKKEKMVKGLKLLKLYEIDFDLHLIFGLPFQTSESFHESLETAIQYKPNGLYLFPLNILKGTPLFFNFPQMGYKYLSEDYNIFTESNWMNSHETSDIKLLANKINALSKQRKHASKPNYNLPLNFAATA